MKIRQAISRIGIATTVIAAPIMLFAPPAHAIAYYDIPCYGFGGEQVYCQLVEDPYATGWYQQAAGILHVYNGTNTYEWVFHLSCQSFGDQDSGANAPSDTSSELGCNLSPINVDQSYIQAI